MAIYGKVKHHLFKNVRSMDILCVWLYDQRGKLKEDHVDLNKLRVRLATLRDACFKQTNKVIKKKSKPASGL
jgi:hypothetical protein